MAGHAENAAALEFGAAPRSWQFWLVASSSALVALVSLRFLILGLGDAFGGMDGHIADRRLLFILHVAASPVALVIGAFQFLPKKGRSALARHRWLGRTYAAAVLTGGIAGLGLAIGIPERPVAATGFGLLAVLWMATTGMAVRYAIRRQITEHRKWMIYSFALTFAAVTLRIQMPFVFASGLAGTYDEASNILAWSCWIPNLVFAWWLLERTAAKPVIRRNWPSG